MRAKLKPHPDTPAQSVAGIEVEVARPDANTLSLVYVLTGALDKVRLPALARPQRTAELWKHTCFEVFIAERGGGYTEFNFAPSRQWAVYRFDDYRSRMRDAESAELRIEPEVFPSRFELRAQIVGVNSEAARLGLTAVIEETNGVKSYWALRHPAGKPDFHHADGFALEFKRLD